jgi:alpha-glucosidase (family GH31 glycosyl hydrolase)
MARRGLVAVIVLAWCSATASAQEVDRTVRAGALSATVQVDPFAIDFGTLRELGTSAGARVVDERRAGDAYVATLDSGSTVRVASDADGVIAVTITRAGIGGVTASFAAADGERFLGLGERSNAVDFRGQQVLNRVSEGPYQPIERPFIAAFVPPAGYSDRDDATYYPVPWVLSTRGYGVLLDNDDSTRFDFAHSDPRAWSAATDTPQLAFRVFAGPTPAKVLERFTARTGRQPPTAAPWFFGPWWQPKGDISQNIATLRGAGALGSVVQTYTHYLPCAAQNSAGERARTKLLNDAGLAVTTYFNPMICTAHPRYAAAKDAGVLTKDLLGNPYTYRYTGSSQFLVSQFDFSNPAAVSFYGSLLREAVDDGYEGWMEDFGEYTPEDSVSADGRPGYEEHNLYPQLYHGAASAFAADSGRALARFNRSGWTGTARYSQLVWGGDPSTTWGFDGLRSAVRNGLSMGLSGVSLWGSDIGGYFALSSPQTTPELLRRWIEVGFASGVMRTQADGFSLGSSPRAEIFDRDVLPVWAKYARLRTQLYPYLAQAERSYDRTGLPIMRQLALAYPADARATARDDEYLFGPDLLAAPVLDQGATTRGLYLPAGRWVDVTGGLLPGRVLAGGDDVTVPAAQDQLPLFARAGALLPLLPTDVQTLTDHGTGVVRLADRARRLRIVGWPRGTTRRIVAPRTIVTVAERGRRLVVRVRGDVRRRYRFELSQVALRRPCASVLRFTIRARSARRVLASCRG